MRQLLLFVLIITICGSLSKPPVVVQPCGSNVKEILYYKGKVVHIDVMDQVRLYGGGVDAPYNCTMHKTPIQFKADSITFQVNFKKLIDVLK